MRDLTTTTEVIDALGGIAAVVDITGGKYNAVANWKAFDTFPSRYFLVMTAALTMKGYRAPAALWAMVEPELERASS
jgi:hypothetical protein